MMAHDDGSPWSSFLTDTDQEIFELAGFGRRGGLGQSPALLVVDVNNTFCGPVELPLKESVQRWRSSCGDRAWTAVRHIAPILAAARAAGAPVVYTTGSDEAGGRGRWHDKVSPETVSRRPEDPYGIVEPIEPGPDEMVIRKSKPSAFFNTMLAPYLIDRGVDSLIVCGGTTSGCVRATVVDAFSHNYRTAVVLEATFDRGEASHAVGLFDMQAKYADVIDARSAADYLSSLATAPSRA
jgi:maleamate amidohydrolase